MWSNNSGLHIGGLVNNFHNQVLGIIRFSMPALSGFKITADAVEQTERLLYDEARLTRRFELFEQFCLPSLMNQEDTRFKALILIGQNLPAAFRDHLEFLIQGCPAAQIIAVKPDRQTEMVTQVLSDYPSAGFTHRTTFRLDDDDMLDINYVTRLRKLSRKLARMTPEKPFAIASNFGLYVTLNGPEPEFFPVRENTPLGLGLSLTAPVDSTQHAFMVNHRLFAGRYNTYSLADKISFIRTIHDHNDGKRLVFGDEKPLDRTEASRILEGQFGVTWETIAGADDLPMVFP